MARKSAVLGSKEMAEAEEKLDFGSFNACMYEAQKAALDCDMGPKDIENFSELKGKLDACKCSLPPLYQESVYEPYVAALDELGEAGFNELLRGDPKRTRGAGLMMDISQAIIQNCDRYAEKATDSFQEVVSDLYDGFLSAEDRIGVKKPDNAVLPPLVKWGRPSSGPYTWPIEATSIFGLEAAIVSLPPANARHDILAWTTLAHETAGHDVLSADDGLAEELSISVRKAITAGGLDPDLAGYWADRIDETASDVMGILNMGPTVGIALIGYFRCLNAAYGHGAKLRNIGDWRDPHPADIVRGYLAASVIRRLSFSKRDDWANFIEAETNKDLSTIELATMEVSPDDAKKSADIVADILVKGKMSCLEDHALGEIEDWRDDDETIVSELRPLLTRLNPLPDYYEEGIYAAHVVAAAVEESLKKDADLGLLFGRMICMLKIMHDANPSWGPLYVRHPGDMVLHKSYIPL
jgi:hypothetical protein